MKNNILIFFISFLSTASFAQKTIEASDLMEDIKKGKTISINNTTVVGTLDFTFKLEGKHVFKQKWINEFQDEQNPYFNILQNKEAFRNGRRNCIFN